MRTVGVVVLCVVATLVGLGVLGVVLDSYDNLTYADGTTGWGFVVPAKTGTQDWELLEQTITPPKPVTALSYHLLLRPPHTGTAWFDDDGTARYRPDVYGRDAKLLEAMEAKGVTMSAAQG